MSIKTSALLWFQVQDHTLRAQVAEVEPQQVALKIKLPDNRTLVAALVQAGLAVKTER